MWGKTIFITRVYTQNAQIFKGLAPLVLRLILPSSRCPQCPLHSDATCTLTPDVPTFSAFQLFHDRSQPCPMESGTDVIQRLPNVFEAGESASCVPCPSPPLFCAIFDASWHPRAPALLLLIDANLLPVYMSNHFANHIFESFRRLSNIYPQVKGQFKYGKKRFPRSWTPPPPHTSRRGYGGPELHPMLPPDWTPQQCPLPSGQHEAQQRWLSTVRIAPDPDTDFQCLSVVSFTVRGLGHAPSPATQFLLLEAKAYAMLEDGAAQFAAKWGYCGNKVALGKGSRSRVCGSAASPSRCPFHPPSWSLEPKL